MSSETEKKRVSKRRLKDENAVRKQVKIAKANGISNKHKTIDQPHRLAKHHAMDCGTPGCVLCSNPRHNKLFKKERLTIQERKFFQDVEHKKSKKGNGLPDYNINE